jgi:hypothetical protein
MGIHCEMAFQWCGKSMVKRLPGVRYMAVNECFPKALQISYLTISYTLFVRLFQQSNPVGDELLYAWTGHDPDLSRHLSMISLVRPCSPNS